MYNMINIFGKMFMYKIGYSNLKIKFKEIYVYFVVEMSGYIFFKECYFGYDDVFYVCLRVLELLFE